MVMEFPHLHWVLIGWIPTVDVNGSSPGLPVEPQLGHLSGSMNIIFSEVPFLYISGLILTNTGSLSISSFVNEAYCTSHIRFGSIQVVLESSSGFS